MLAKKQKKRKGMPIKINKNKIATAFWIFFCAVFVGYLLYCNIRIFEKRNNIKKSADKLDQSINTLTKEKETLSFTLGQTYSEDYIEKVAREDFGMQKSGEEVIVIKKQGGESSTTASSQNGIWQKIVSWLGLIRSKFWPE
jgi:cell division protein FtsB